MCTKISDVSNEQYQIKYLRKYLLNPQRTQPLCLGCLQPTDLSCLCPVCKFPFCRCLIKSFFCQHMIFFFAGQNACKMPRKLTAENVRWFSTMFVANTKKYIFVALVISQNCNFFCPPFPCGQSLQESDS